MNKKELIAKAAEIAGVSQKDTGNVLNAIIDEIINAVASGDSVQLIGFGTFQPVLQKGRTGIKPGTNESYTTKDKQVPKFKAGKIFKDIVSKGK